MEIICSRCGYFFLATPNRKAPEKCQSCRARKVQVINGCIPWHGSFGADMVTPIHDDGSEVLPGLRKCGNLDCVNPIHVTK